MNFCLRKIGVMTTILVPFLEVTTGFAASAIVFWLTLFWAAAMNDPVDDRRFANGDR
jgi:hypothetical protein